MKTKKWAIFLPKSMFLNEIWVKNRPFSLFFGKIGLNLQSVSKRIKSEENGNKQ